MSKELEEINRRLGELLANSEHTKKSISSIEDRLNDHIDKDGRVYSHIDKKVKHAENRLKLLIDSNDLEVNKKCSSVEMNCAPRFLEKQMNAIWSLVALILIGSVSYFAIHVAGDLARNKKLNTPQDAVMPLKRGDSPDDTNLTLE